MPNLPFHSISFRSLYLLCLTPFLTPRTLYNAHCRAAITHPGSFSLSPFLALSVSLRILCTNTGKYVGCGSSFGNIFVWKTVGGSLQSVCKGHKDSVRGFGWGTAATKEGSHEVVSVDKHGVMILW